MDSENGNNFWQEAIDIKMKKLGIAFEVLDDGEQATIGWKKVTVPLVCDVNMDFTQISRWVLDGYLTLSPIGYTYVGVVYRESVHINFKHSTLNVLDICAYDIRNAYLQEQLPQKDFIICGSEFRLEDFGKLALIHRAQCVGKLSSKDFRNHLRVCMQYIYFSLFPQILK